jgi:hypothetical protein
LSRRTYATPIILPKEQAVTASKQTTTLTMSQKIALRLKPPDLRHANHTAIIGIECGID